MTVTHPGNSTLTPREKLRKMLPHWPEVDWVAEIGSTNAELLAHTRLARHSEQWPRLLGTDHQTHGKGRSGRPWVDRSGQTLMFSCGFMLQMPARLLAGVAPALGIAACAALRPLAGHQPQRLSMKWPNDIMLDDSKLAGILVESRIQADQIFLVAGIGLNLHGGSDLSAELNRAVSDWSDLAGATMDRFVLAAAISESWAHCIDGYDNNRLLSLIERFQTFDYLREKSVNILQGERVLMSGTAGGMSEDGSLILRLPDSSVQHVMVGDVSVRQT